jgi:hypothetical protein
MNRLLVIFRFSCLYFIAIIAVADDPKIVATNISSNVTMVIVAVEKNRNGIYNKWIKVVKRDGKRIAIITKCITDEGLTNITSSFIVDNAIVLTTVNTNGNNNSEKFFIINPTTRNVEGFISTSMGDIRPLPESELMQYKSEIKNFN